MGFRRKAETDLPVIRRRFITPFAKWTLPFLFAAALIVTHAQAGIDFLKMSAFQSERAAQGLLLDVVDTGKRLVAVGERGHIVYSTDQGRSWQQAEVPVYTTLTAVHFPVPDKGWAVGHDGVVLHSSDGGTSWTKQLDGYSINAHVLVQSKIRFHTDRSALTDAAGDEQRTEAEERLEEAKFAVDDAREDARRGPAKPLLNVWFKNENEGFVVGSYGIFLHTADGGETWNPWSDRLDNPDNFHLNAIAATDSGILMLVGEAGSIHRSSDGGESWQRLDSPYEGSYFGLLSTNGKLLAFGLRGSFYRSEDLGDSWRPITLPAPIALADGVVMSNGNIAVVGSGGGVIYSEDGGNSFSLTERPDRLPLSAVAEIGDNRLLVVGVRGARLVNSRGIDLAPGD